MARRYCQGFGCGYPFDGEGRYCFDCSLLERSWAVYLELLGRLRHVVPWMFDFEEAE